MRASILKAAKMSHASRCTYGQPRFSGGLNWPLIVDDEKKHFEGKVSEIGRPTPQHHPTLF